MKKNNIYNIKNDIDIIKWYEEYGKPMGYKNLITKIIAICNHYYHDYKINPTIIIDKNIFNNMLNDMDIHYLIDLSNSNRFKFHNYELYTTDLLDNFFAICENYNGFKKIFRKDKINKIMNNE